MALKDLKKLKEQISGSLQQLQNTKTADSPTDDRIFNLTKDAAGNSSATIRFLPQQDPSKAPMVKLFRHGHEQKGRWFIEECPTTIAKKCPVCEYSSSIWDDGDGSEMAKKQNPGRPWWKKKSYACNILIIDDPGNPENNGKVMIFKFGQQIYDMIIKVTSPENPEDRMDVFDFDDGYNFKLNCIQVSGFNNYDRKSSFSLKPSAIAGGNEKEQEKIYDMIIDLSEFHDPKLFKSEEDIKEKLDRYLGVKTGGKVTTLVEEIAEKKKEGAKRENVPAPDDTDDLDMDFDLDEDDDDIVL